ncbi:MAG: hypothetical protein JSV95_12005 [Gemmatimonadota bacterium]|nr:MAG: hypothetical protein JSV95_12005 [Gemmatimonadota bacterium]
MVQRSGPVGACLAVSLLVPMACQSGAERDAARQIGIRAVGNEPGWTLKLHRERGVWTTDYGSVRYEFAVPETLLQSDTDRAVHVASFDGHQLTIEIRREECFDNMSGERFELVVDLTFDGRWRPGCGRFRAEGE